MEIWDILHEDGSRTGRTIERGQLLGEGEYHLVVHIWIRNNKGEYLIQKRAEKLERWSGMWAVAGGSALAGESSLAAALREVREELGISLEQYMLSKLTRVKLNNVLSDLWLVLKEVDLRDVVMQKEEVSEVRYADLAEIGKMIGSDEFIDYGKDYMSLLY